MIEGYTPTFETVYEYDDEGRLSRSVTRALESEWNDESRAAALALSVYESGLCPCGCGYPAEVSQHPDNEFAFEADGPYRCHARTALLRATAQDDSETQFPEALLWGAAKKP